MRCQCDLTVRGRDGVYGGMQRRRRRERRTVRRSKEERRVMKMRVGGRREGIMCVRW
jgi:hypothetical protein